MVRSCGLATLAVFASLAAQNPPPRGAQIPGPMSDFGGANLPALKIGPNDLLSVSVYDSPELTRTIRVSAEGDIRLPMLTERLHVQGLMPAQVESLISAALEKAGLLVNPIVSVSVAEYFSRPVAVSGSVKTPITFQAFGQVTLLDALNRAGGFSDTAGPDILLTRDRKNPTTGEVFRAVERIKIRDLIDGAKPELNVQLTGGEEVRVPEAHKVYVTGNVKAPGSFLIKEQNQLSVLRAVGLAQGTLPYCSKYAYIYRPDEQVLGGKKEIQIEFKLILERKAVDIGLEPEDTLYIPEATAKKNWLTAADKITAFGTATVSGVLIWGVAR